MRVVLADPPAYTPPYDHALAAALARQGVDVRLLTSRFRYGDVPAADRVHGRRQPLPRSRRGSGRRAGRLAAKALEHPLALARLALADCDLVHLQWLAAPEADAWLLHTRRPLVFTAHDLLPRRTARHTRTLAAAVPPLRPDRHAQRARPPHARGVRRPRAEAAGDPPSRASAAIRCATTTAARCSRSA